METVAFTLKGTRPLLFCKEPEQYEEAENKKPTARERNEDPYKIAERHLHLCTNGNGSKKHPGIPAINIQKCLQYATTMALGRSRRPMAKIVKTITIDPMILPITPEEWTLDTRRAGTKSYGGRAGGTGALLYRPRFDSWQVSGEATYDSSEQAGISEEELRRLFDMAGFADGLGSYRIGNGGPFGRFIVTEWKGK